MSNQNKKFIVYVHTNILNGKRYVGITCQSLKARCGKDGSKYSRSNYFMSAIKKYGWKNFTHTIIARNLTKEEAEAMEVKLIANWKLTQKGFGYNLCEGGRLNIPNEETRKKISNAQKGRVFSKETKEKISASNKGRVLSEETRKKISEATKGRVSPRKGKKLSEETKKKLRNYMLGKPSPMKFKHHTEKTKELLSKINKGKKLSEETKRKIGEASKKQKHTGKGVLCVELNRRFEKIKDAIRELNLNKNVKICECCKKKGKTAGGYHWVYLNNDGSVSLNGLEKFLYKKPIIRGKRGCKIYCVELDRIFKNSNIASKKTGVSLTTINLCCKGKQKTSGGYHWRYFIEDGNNT